MEVSLLKSPDMQQWIKNDPVIKAVSVGFAVAPLALISVETVPIISYGMSKTLCTAIETQAFIQSSEALTYVTGVIIGYIGSDPKFDLPINVEMPKILEGPHFEVGIQTGELIRNIENIDEQK